MTSLVLLILVFYGWLGTVDLATAKGSELPNIVVMLADDMGYGEVQCLNPKRGKIPTPCLDQLAASGMVFTDAHSGSSVCTPTRYGLLTGRYAWRTRLQRGVLTGGESLIARDRLTLPKMLKSKGYHTACIGKWHLGTLFDGKKNAKMGIPIGSKVTEGPIDRGGFDIFYGFHHARQMDIWIKDNVVVEHIKPIEMLPGLTEKAVEYIESRKEKPQPFFLYVPWNSPHSPVVPTEEWKGRSGLNEHADFVMQTDDSFGRVIQALKDNKLFEDTLIICSSDNGTSAPSSKMAQLKKLGHFSSAYLRGSKADIWDGGHRVPFMVSWPKTIKTGRRSDQLVCLTDVMATVAEIVGFEADANEMEDSISFLPILNGKETGNRANVVHHSSTGRFAIRDGDWKLNLCAGSGGWSQPKDKQALKEGAPKWQLYDLRNDIQESKNLVNSRPGKKQQLFSLIKMHVENGRSTPGERTSNDVQVDFEKSIPRQTGNSSN